MVKTINVMIKPELLARIIRGEKFKILEFIVDPGQVKDIPDPDLCMDITFTAPVVEKIMKGGYHHNFRGNEFLFELVCATTEERTRLVHLIEQNYITKEKGGINGIADFKN